MDFHYQCHFTEVQPLFSLAIPQRLAESFELFITFLAVSYDRIFPTEPVFATMDLKSSTLLEAWLLSVQNGISNHNLKLGMVARACKENLLKMFLSYMAWSRTAQATQGPISTHPLSHSRKSLYEYLLLLRWPLFEGESWGTAVCLFKERTLHSQAWWSWQSRMAANLRPSCLSLLCVRIQVCVTTPGGYSPFSEIVYCANILVLCCTLCLLSPSSANNVYLLLLGFSHLIL